MGRSGRSSKSLLKRSGFSARRPETVTQSRRPRSHKTTWRMCRFSESEKNSSSLVSMCAIVRTYMTGADTPKDVERWFQRAMAKLWPVAEGSLSLRRSPCIRENCQACARGEGHPSYVLYARRGGRRVSIYVPADIAPKIEEAIENGRHLQELINEAGVRYVEAVKRERARRSRGGS